MGRLSNQENWKFVICKITCLCRKSTYIEYAMYKYAMYLIYMNCHHQIIVLVLRVNSRQSLNLETEKNCHAQANFYIVTPNPTYLLSHRRAVVYIT